MVRVMNIALPERRLGMSRHKKIYDMLDSLEPNNCLLIQYAEIGKVKNPQSHIAKMAERIFGKGQYHIRNLQELRAFGVWKK